MTLLLGEQAGDSRESPVLVGLLKLGRDNARVREAPTKKPQRLLITRSEMDVGGMVVGRATVLIGVLNGSVASLNSLVRDGDIAARDGVQV
jgi:hypothetical protein